MSQQKEAKRFLSALNRQSELQQKDCFTISVCLHAFMRFCNYSCSFSDSYSRNPLLFQEIYSLADRIGLRVPDIDTFVDNLNSVGYLLKKGAKTYQVLQPADNHRQPIWVTHKIPMPTTQTITLSMMIFMSSSSYLTMILFRYYHRLILGVNHPQGQEAKVSAAVHATSKFVHLKVCFRSKSTCRI